MHREHIRDLNAAFRSSLAPHLGRVLCTAGVSDMGTAFIEKCLHLVKSFGDFDDQNDPWGEHDFGSFEVDGHRLFFKIDYYADASLKYGAEDPTDPKRQCPTTPHLSTVVPLGSGARRAQGASRSNLRPARRSATGTRCLLRRPVRAPLPGG